MNTQGGPKRDAQARILDVHGDPIPHLYGAGECGAMWSDVYPGGGNIGEALSYGLIAGEALAVKKDDVSAESFMGGKEPASFTFEPPTFAAEAGNEFVGMARGIGGPIWVKVTVDGGAWSLEVLHDYETPGIGAKAVEALPPLMVEAQSADVDAYTGATATSKALTAAVKDALAQAGIE